MRENIIHYKGERFETLDLIGQWETYEIDEGGQLFPYYPNARDRKE